MKACRATLMLLIAGACWLVGVAPAVASGLSHPAQTTPWYTFDPKEGGPGTSVRVRGEQWWGDVAQIYISKDPHEWPINPPGPPLASTHPDRSGHWEATVVIPARWANGDPITSGPIFIIAPSGAGFFPFRYHYSNGMPATGQVEPPVPLIWMALAIVALGVGLRVIEAKRPATSRVH